MNRVTTSDDFGKQQRYWDGFNISANGRLPRGATVGGGVDFGRQVDDHCYTVDIPNQPAGLTGAQLAGGPFCKIVTSWANLLDFRLRGSAPLPFDMSAGFVYRNTPGAEVNANLTLHARFVRHPFQERPAVVRLEHGDEDDSALHAEFDLRRPLQPARPGAQQALEPGRDAAHHESRSL